MPAVTDRERFVSRCKALGAAYLLAPETTSDPLTNLGSLALSPAELKNGAALSASGLIGGGVAAALDGTNDYIETGWTTRTNRCKHNPGFESADISKYAGISGSTLEHSSEHTAHGSGALKMTATGATLGAGSSTTPADYISVTAGEQLTLSWYLYIPGGSTTVRVQVSWRDAAAAEISKSFTGTLTVPTNTLTRVSMTATAPEKTVGLVYQIYAKDGGGKAGDTAWVDSILIEPASSVGSFFPEPSHLESGLAGEAADGTFDIGPLARGTGRTFVAAAKPSDLNDRVIFAGEGATSVAQLMLQATPQVRFNADTAATQVVWPAPATVGAELSAFLGHTYDDLNSVTSLAVNGIPQGSIAETDTFPTGQKLLLGARSIGGVQERFFKGSLLPFAVFTRALSEAELYMLYRSSIPIRKFVKGKPALALDVEVETPDGTFRLATDSRKASKRPSGITFGTQRGDGFATGGYKLSRPILKDYPDIGLMDTHRFIGREGDVAYEGRLHSNPRTNDPQPTIDMALVGWMTYLKGRRISPLIIDRRLGMWADISSQLRANLLAAGYRFAGEFTTANEGAGETGPAVVLSFTNDFNKTYKEVAEAMFYAGGEDIGKLRYDFKDLAALGTNADWEDRGFLCTDDLGNGEIAGTDVNRTNSIGDTVTATGPGFTHAFLKSTYHGEATGPVNEGHGFIYPQVIGNHGLTERGTHPSIGYHLTDVLDYVLATYFPKIDRSAIQTNTFPMEQGAWHDAPTDGWTLMQFLNNLVLWETNMWEERKLHFEPADLTSCDWQIRTDDPGVTVMFQGDSIESFANGASVTYTDFWNVKRTIYPDENDELRDDSESNPANRHGEALWVDVEVPWQCTEAEAVQFARAYLAEYLRPKRPGTYRIAGGYIKDYAGHWHQGWRLRCSETLGILDHPADEPRLITGTSWDAESATLIIDVDAPSKVLDAVIARQELARTSRNL